MESMYSVLVLTERKHVEGEAAAELDRVLREEAQILSASISRLDLVVEVKNVL